MTYLRKTKPFPLAGALGAAVLGLSACSSGAEADPGNTSTDSTTSAEPTENSEATPRLVVAYDEHAEVFDATSLESIATFPTDSSPYVQVAADGRHVFLLSHETEQVGLIDAGSWGESHGDHGHYYTADPSDTGLELDGLSYHAVSDDERSVVWLDDQGAFGVITAEQLESGDPEPEIIEAGEPHHGVAVPTADGGYLATVSVDEEATGVAVLDVDGTETARFESCPGLHGETHAGETGYAFGCADGVLLVDDGQASNISSPVDGAGSGALAADHASPIVAGDLRNDADDPALATKVALYDTSTGTSSAVDVGAPYSNLVVSEGTAFVIGTDGAVRSIDLETGTVTQTPAIAAWDKTEDWKEPRPYLTASPDTVWITDPHSGKIHALDLATSELTSAEVDGEPGPVVVVGDGH